MRLLLISIFVTSLIGFALIPDTFGITDFVEIPTGSSTANCNTTNVCFTPDKIEIKKGDTIKWRNFDTTAHTATSTNGMFDSGLLLKNIKQNACFPNCHPTFSYTFNEDGKYSYSCKIHSWMQGIVIVTSVGTGAEVSVCGEGGCAYVDKALYQMIRDKNTLVKIYGTLVNPGSGAILYMSVTFPDGHIEDLSRLVYTKTGYYETKVNTQNSSGKFSVDVRFDTRNVGTVEFEVVEAAKVEEPPTLVSPEHFTSPPPDRSDAFFDVWTDSQSYKKGSSILISGQIHNPFDQSDASEVSQLTLRITDPRNNIVTVSQLNPNADGTYFVSINGEGPMWKFGGDYTVMVNYGGQSASTTFAFTIPENDFPIPSPAGQVPTKASTVLTLVPLPSTVEVGESLTFSGSLMTADGIPVTDKKISLRNGMDELGWIHTRLDGTFAGTMEMNIQNDYSVFAFFYGGSSNFETSQSQTEHFTVTQKSSSGQPITTPPVADGTAGVVFLLVIIMIVVIAAIAIKKRKKKIPATITPPSGGGTAGTVTIPKPRKTLRAGSAPIFRHGRTKTSPIINPFSQQIRKAKRAVGRQSPKAKSKIDTIHYLRCKVCRSEELENEAGGQQYCTKCKWRKI